MQILGPNAFESSSAFIIAPGKQITLHAEGLAAGDVVTVEILELSAAAPFNGNPCCNLDVSKIEVLRRTPLRCPNGTAVALTADYPYGVIDTPQGIALGVSLAAAAGSAVSVFAEETASTGCMACICERPCVDTAWNSTGETRCNGNSIETREESNCGNVRWVVTGSTTWVATGDTRCNNHVIEQEEVNDCGKTRWTATAQGCGYCPSLRLSCDGTQPGYGYHELDPKDPAATIEIAPCAGDTTVDSIWIYPSAGEGHTVKVLDCDGTIVGYAVNRSDCAPECGCASQEIKVNVAAPVVNVAPAEVSVRAINNFSPTTNVAAPNVTLPSPNVVAAEFDQNGELTVTSSDGSAVTAQIPTC